MRKKRRGLIGAILLLMWIIGLSSIGHAGEKPIELYLNGYQLKVDVPPRIINDRVMVPVRCISENIGAIVEWETEAQKIMLYRGKSIIEPQIAEDTIKIYTKYTKDEKR